MLPNTHISLSICIVCYDTPLEQLVNLIDTLSTSLRKLQERYKVPTVPVYIVDNSDESGDFNYLISGQSASFDGSLIEIDYIQGQGNIGYGSAHNLVLDNLNSDFHLMLNPDVIVDEEALLNAISLIERGNRVIGISPNAYNMLGEKQYLCKRYPSVFTLFLRGFLPKPFENIFSKRFAAYEMREICKTEEPKEVELISGCFMLLNTQVLKLVGGFNEHYFLYFEDFDLSIRLRKYGKLVYAPKVRIKHLGGGAAKKGLSHIILFCRSGIRFFNSYRWEFF